MKCTERGTAADLQRRMNNMKVSMNKKYRTRDGHKVRVICIDRDAPYSVVALIGTHSLVETYSSEGMCGILSMHPNDLVEIHEWDDFKIDEPVMVRLGNGAWIHGCFAGVSETGEPQTWSDGRISWTEVGVRAWDECRRPTEET